MKSTELFSRVIVDGGTLVWGCKVDCNTKFEAVGLDNMRIYPATKQLLEHNIRRMNWEAWYEYKDWDKIKPEEKRKRLHKKRKLKLQQHNHPHPKATNLQGQDIPGKQYPQKQVTS